jgi:hypothetical protein
MSSPRLLASQPGRGTRVRRTTSASCWRPVWRLWRALRTGSPAGRIRAAKTLLELGLKVADGEIDERLERLEEAWQASSTEPPGLRSLSA